MAVASKAMKTVSMILSQVTFAVSVIRGDPTRTRTVARMAWASANVQPEEKLNRAQFLRNRFMVNKKAMIEKRRLAAGSLVVTVLLFVGIWWLA